MAPGGGMIGAGRRGMAPWIVARYGTRYRRNEKRRGPFGPASLINA